MLIKLCAPTAQVLLARLIKYYNTKSRSVAACRRGEPGGGCRPPIASLPRVARKFERGPKIIELFAFAGYLGGASGRAGSAKAY